MEKQSVLGYHRQLDAIDYTQDGGLVLGASSLTNRYWTGLLSYFDPIGNEENFNVDNSQASAQIDSGVTDLKCVKDVGRIVVSCDSGAVGLWEVALEQNTIDCIVQHVEHDDIVTSVAINSVSTKLATTSYDRTIKIWDLEEFIPISQFTAHFDTVWCSAFHPKHPDVFISCSQDKRLLLWDLRKPKPAQMIDNSTLPTCVAWQPDNEHNIAVGTEMGSIVYQDSRRESETSPIIVSTHERMVQRISFAPTRSNCLASVSNDSTVAVTEFTGKEGNVVYRDRSHQDFVQSLAWNPKNNKLTTCSWDYTVLTRSIQGSSINNKMET